MLYAHFNFPNNIYQLFIFSLNLTVFFQLLKIFL